MGFEREDLYGDEPPQYPDGVNPSIAPTSSYTPSPTYDADRWEARNQLVELDGDTEYDEETEKLHAIREADFEAGKRGNNLFI